MTNHTMNHVKHRAFPSFMMEYGKQTIEFLGDYIDWLNEKGNASYVIDHISSEIDIDLSVDAYVSHLRERTLKDFPYTLVGNLKLLLKNVFYYYNAKSSLASYDFLFQCLFGTSVYITYPKDNVLIPSGSIYINSNELALSDTYFYDNISKFKNYRIVVENNGIILKGCNIFDSITERTDIENHFKTTYDSFVDWKQDIYENTDNNRYRHKCP